MKVRVLSQRGGDWLRGKLVSVHPHASKTATLPATGLERVSTWLDSFSGRIGAGFRGDQIRSPSRASENRKPGLTPRSLVLRRCAERWFSTRGFRTPLFVGR